MNFTVVFLKNGKTKLVKEEVQVEYTDLSNCCGAEMEQDTCKDCKEHCISQYEQEKLETKERSRKAIERAIKSIGYRVTKDEAVYKRKDGKSKVKENIKHIENLFKQ